MNSAARNLPGLDPPRAPGCYAPTMHDQARRLLARGWRMALTPLLPLATRRWRKRLPAEWFSHPPLRAEQRVIRVPLAAITHYLDRMPTRFVRDSLVIGGGWDRLARPLEDPLWILGSCHTRSVFQIFAAGLPARDCDEFRKLARHLRRYGRARDNIRTGLQLKRYFADMHKTFRDMHARGYRSQQELGGRPNHEIQVAITRNGHLARVGNGLHRFAMARILGLPEIVVQVRHIHPAWLAPVLRKAGNDPAADVTRAIRAEALRILN